MQVQAEQEVAATDGDAAVLIAVPDTVSSAGTVVEAAAKTPNTIDSASTTSVTVEAGTGEVPLAVAAEEEGGDTTDKAPVYGRWPATLDARWAEVEFMLCHEVDCEESLQYTIQATEAGLVFMGKLEEKARVSRRCCVPR